MYMVLAAATFWKCVCSDSHRRNDDDDVQPGSEFVGYSSFANIWICPSTVLVQVGSLAAVDDRLKRHHHMF